MRVIAVLLVLAGIAAASTQANAGTVTFRLFLSYYDMMEPDERGKMAEFCKMAAVEAAIRHAGSEAWQGMVQQCFGQAQLVDDEGHELAACEYFIDAAKHYQKARPAAHEVEALRLSADEVKQEIAKLGC